ncbi:MAG: alanine--tRNA ligase [Candidatus Gracilibacteria bacterium]
MPTANQIRRQYIDFFVKRNHKEIGSASLIPENDPTVLFTTAGMHPLVPYFMGEAHPAGKRIVDVQKCVRTDDIDEVGDTTHCTFFEMLGNWSLGDYFKDEAIKMSFELLTLPWDKGGFGLDIKKMAVSCFAGDSDAPKDEESAKIWESLGIAKDRIAFLPKKNNWWGPAGKTGPCGPDTEMFFWSGAGEAPQKFDPEDAKWVEVWNDVFMKYYKTAEGKFEPLSQTNVDTGMGFERMTAVLQGKSSPFETELFADAMAKIAELSGQADTKSPDYAKSSRIIADHLRAATFIMGDRQGVTPSNIDQGYIVRRLIRRAIRHGKLIGINKSFTAQIASIFIKNYGEIYSELAQNSDKIINEFNKEEERFSVTIERGIKELQRLVCHKTEGQQMTGEEAFYVFETYGFPLEMIVEELASSNCIVKLDSFKADFDAAFKKHQEQSRAGALQKFASGLADTSDATKMHHSATHLLQAALRLVLGPHVAQKGSNVTKERLRFDFSHPQKMTPEEIKKVEDIVNEQINKDLPVKCEMMTVEEAKKHGAIGLFEDKYSTLGDKVKAYFMGDFSKEICGGPHVDHLGVLKHFKILKEEASSSGVRRIKAVVDGITGL